MNKIIIDGRILDNTEAQPKRFNYVKGSDSTGKKSVLVMTLISQKNFSKPDADGHYQYNFIQVKAFGPKADFIFRNFKPGDSILVEGTMEIEKGTEKEDGSKWPDRTVVYVDNQYFCARGTNDVAGRSAGNNAAAAATVAVPNAQPSVGFTRVNTNKPF